MDESVVVLWGDMAAGKTSLLATGLLGPGAYARLDSVVKWDACIEDVQGQLHLQYRILANGQLAPGTMTPLSVPVVLRSGRRVVFRDLMGERTREPEKHEMGKELARAAAALFVLTWDESAERRRQFEAVQTALPILGARPRALAFTKCERGLPHGHPAWDVGRGPRDGWWDRAADWTENERHLLGQVGPIWPTSAYGFHRGRPACVLDEFGETIPLAVSPVNTTEVIEWVLRQLDR